MKNNKPAYAKATASKPIVSVIMPVKDAGEFVVESIESIRKQTLTDWEMIIVDDGSRDVTTKILKKYAKKDKRIQVIRHEIPQGIAKSLNECLKLAKGKYIARMDGDDVSYPTRLAEQIEYLEKNRSVVAVGGQVVMIDNKGMEFAEKNFPTDSKRLRDVIMWMVPMQHPAMMVRGSKYRKCKYDERFRTAEDVEMMMQLLQYGEFANLDTPVLKYRKADTSNGYHDVKRTFYWTMYGRILGIVKYGYRPSVKGMMLSMIQVLVVGIMPAKLVVRLYESRRFVWLVKAYLGRLLTAQAKA
jgi:glycosyltransferase involved in cell wall biosynthesis